jgi:hypothetical protein
MNTYQAKPPWRYQRKKAILRGAINTKNQPDGKICH